MHASASPIWLAGSATPFNFVVSERATGVTRLRGSCSVGALYHAPGLAFELNPCVLMRLTPSKAVMPCTKSKMLSGLRFTSPRTASMTFDVSALERPLLRRKFSRSSSVRATIRCRAAAMPATNGTGEELAKFVNADTASWAKRCAANFEWRM